MGFPKITANTPPFSLIAIWPVFVSPELGECEPTRNLTVYLSWAEMALPPKTPSTTARITISEDAILVMAHSCQPLRPAY